MQFFKISLIEKLSVKNQKTKIYNYPLENEERERNLPRKESTRN